MNTYMSFNDCKLSNPEYDVYYHPKLGFCAFKNTKPTGNWVLANPADYLMTVKQFLKEGNFFAKGDMAIRADGSIATVSKPSEWDVASTGDDKRYVLKAAAFEKDYFKKEPSDPIARAVKRTEEIKSFVANLNKPLITKDPDGVDRGSKYRKTIYNNQGESLDGVDIYDMADALGISCNALFHAWKKIALAGKRGAKDFNTDIDEAINSLERAKRLHANKTPTDN